MPKISKQKLAELRARGIEVTSEEDSPAPPSKEDATPAVRDHANELIEGLTKAFERILTPNVQVNVPAVPEERTQFKRMKVSAKVRGRDSKGAASDWELDITVIE